jgi:predicted RNase H-like HicB family nuclease
MSPSAWSKFMGQMRRTLRRFEDERQDDRSTFQFVLEIEEDEDDGGYIAYFPSAPGIISQGDTRQQAVENVASAFTEVMVAKLNREEQRRDHDAPSVPLKLAL